MAEATAVASSVGAVQQQIQTACMQKQQRSPPCNQSVQGLVAAIETEAGVSVAREGRRQDDANVSARVQTGRGDRRVEKSLRPLCGDELRLWLIDAMHAHW